jgi:comEA protein
MQMFSFTPQETKALIFLLAALLVGSGITLYKRTHFKFAPELIMEKRELEAKPQAQAFSNEEQEEIKINLNLATAAELQLLPGVGPTLSKRIVEYRENSGRFEKIEDLMRVQGIGLKTFEQVRDKITVE